MLNPLAKEKDFTSLVAFHILKSIGERKIFTPNKTVATRKAGINMIRNILSTLKFNL